MTEPTQEIETTPEGVEPDETTPDEQEEAAEPDPRIVKARNEAKNLRTRLREAESERDTLRTSLDTYNRIDAGQIAAEYLSDGDDLFRGGVELADLLGADGTIDDDLVHEAARRVAAEHPNWTPSRVVPALRPGIPQINGKTWQKLLKG